MIKKPSPNLRRFFLVQLKIQNKKNRLIKIRRLALLGFNLNYFVVAVFEILSTVGMITST
jgi:hypothetical protein